MLRALAPFVWTLGLAGCGGAGEHPAAAASTSPPVAAAGGRVDISIVQTGFSPDHIEVERAKPVTLVFTRKVEHTCVDKVVFPAEKIEKDVPMGQPVEVALAPAADTTFRCPMGHAIGRLTVR
jgi:plastocyanin domain-containing protein